jgi:aspartate aminotransferase
MAGNERLGLPLNLNVRGLGKSPTVAINERCDALAREGREVVKLGLGQSPFPVPPEVVEALRDHAPRKEYLPVRGLPALREAVADYHRRRHGTGCGPDDVLVGPGSKELMFLLQVVYYGDLVVPTPAWVSYAPQAQIVGRRVRFLHTRADRGWKLSPDQLERLCHEDPGRPRILVLNYPSNPTGGSYSVGELEDLARVARRFAVVVLSDEIYGELHHRGEHLSIERCYADGTIVSSGLSKWCGAGGWRLGTFAFPRALRWLLEAMEVVASETYTSTSAPIQYAAVRAFQGGLWMERYLWHARHVLRALGALAAKRLRAVGLHVEEPVGGFYLFPDFSPLAERLAGRGIASSADLCERLLEETGVAILPGSSFGRDASELTARLAYVDFDGARALAAAETLGPEAAIDAAFLEQHCGRTLAGVERLCKWLA